MSEAGAQRNQGIVTEEILKKETGEFCLESIFILDFSGKGIFSPGCITKCLNLSVLDLSNNHLSAVGELAVLSNLEHLDLSSNNITHLDGFHKLENLSRLELAGNKISSFDTLLPLSSLCKLKHLTLQLPNLPSRSSQQAPLSNPVCTHETYTRTMLDIFPALVWLDKEMVTGDGEGRTFYSECADIQNSVGKSAKDKDSSGYTALKVPDLEDPLKAVNTTTESEERIKELLMECMDSSSKVQKFVSNVRSELKMSNSLTAEH